MEKIVGGRERDEAGAMEFFPEVHPRLALNASGIRVTLSIHF